MDADDRHNAGSEAVLVKATWAECAMPGCRRLYWRDDAHQRFCGRTCARGYDRLAAHPTRLKRVEAIAREIDATDIFDRPAIMAALKG